MNPSLVRAANDALLKRRVRFTSPYDFMFNSTYLSPIEPLWSELVAYDLIGGEIKWRVSYRRVPALENLAFRPTAARSGREVPAIDWIRASGVKGLDTVRAS